MNWKALSVVILAVVPVAASAAPVAEVVLPEYEIMTFCNHEAGETEGMWRWECRSMEEDCREALRTLPQKTVDACVRRVGSKGSYCALLVCGAPDTETAQMAQNVIPRLKER